MTPIFNWMPAESNPGCISGVNLLIPAQICDELSCGQCKVYGRTDGRTRATTLPLRPERPRGKKNRERICCMRPSLLMAAFGLVPISNQAPNIMVMSIAGDQFPLNKLITHTVFYWFQWGSFIHHHVCLWPANRTVLWVDQGDFSHTNDHKGGV